jgi:asparagine synthase (glutamine-hydrolysing)
VFRVLAPLIPAGARDRSDRVHKLARALGAPSAAALYVQLASQWQDPTTVVLGATEPPTVLTDETQWPDLAEFIEHMMLVDTVTYLPDDILAKVDRATMGVSLEGRLPFLDHRVIDFAWRLPLSWKVRGTEGKWLLRQVLYRYVPQALIERPKMGFGVPIGAWLRGPLSEWANELLDERRLRADGLLDPSLIGVKWREHLSGVQDQQYLLWPILMLHAWMDEQLAPFRGAELVATGD